MDNQDVGSTISNKNKHIKKEEIMHSYRSAYTTALLLIINEKLYGIEKGESYAADHCRFSRQILGKCANRKQLKESFLSELSDELYELGWIFCKTNDHNTFSIFSAKRLEKWTKLSSKRLRTEGFFEKNEEEIEDAYLQFFADEENTEDDE